MKLTTTLLVSSLLAASTVATSVQAADAPVTANFGVTSNYIWRGKTQGSDDSAVSGGVDYAHDSGFYIGTWISSLGGNNQYENDIYAGYTMEAGKLGMDFGTILYRYPVGNAQSDFQEIYAHFSISDFEFGADYTVNKEGASSNENDLYLWGSWSTELKKGLGLSLTVGSYDVDGSSTDDYTHFQAALSKGDFTFALDKNDHSDADSGTVGTNDLRMTISWGQEFDL